MHTPFAILVTVLVAGVTIGLFLQRRLFERLRSEHPSTLKILAESSAGIMAFQRYLWRRHYRGLGDASLIRRADSIRRYWTVLLLYFLLVVLALVLALGFRI